MNAGTTDRVAVRGINITITGSGVGIDGLG